MKEDKKKKGWKAFVDRHYGEELAPNKWRKPLKIAGDLGAATIGTIGGTLPKNLGLFLGIGLIITGRLANDKTGLLSIAGSSMLGYSVAMAKENSQAEQTVDGVTSSTVTEGIKAKFSRLKENWLHATYLNKVLGEKAPSEETTEESDQSVGAVDLSELNQIDRKVEESSVNAEIRRAINQEKEPLLVAFEDEFEEKENEPIELHLLKNSDDEFDHFAMATM